MRRVRRVKYGGCVGEVWRVRRVKYGGCVGEVWRV